MLVMQISDVGSSVRATINLCDSGSQCPSLSCTVLAGSPAGFL